MGGAVALLGMLLLGGCALTPPILGGPLPDGGASTGGSVWTDADVAALLILNDPESALGASSVADYRADALAATPEVQPAPCRESFAALVLAGRDELAAGTVFRLPPLFREAPGADLLVTQVARRFETTDEAGAFLDALRAARESCPVMTTPDGSTVEQLASDGDVPVGAARFDVTTTASDGSATATTEWVLVARNLAISVRAEVPDEEAAATLRDLAEEYADAMK